MVLSFFPLHLSQTEIDSGMENGAEGEMCLRMTDQNDD